MISPSIAARFDIHNPDFSEEAAFRRRAERDGRTLAEQIKFEEDCADRINAQAQVTARAAYEERRAMWGGSSFADRSDRWPSRRGHFEGDPMEAEWSG